MPRSDPGFDRKTCQQGKEGDHPSHPPWSKKPEPFWLRSPARARRPFRRLHLDCISLSIFRRRKCSEPPPSFVFQGLLLVFSGDSTIIQQFQVLGELLRLRNDFYPVTGKPNAEKLQVMSGLLLETVQPGFGGAAHGTHSTCLIDARDCCAPYGSTAVPAACVSRSLTQLKIWGLVSFASCFCFCFCRRTVHHCVTTERYLVEKPVWYSTVI